MAGPNSSVPINGVTHEGTICFTLPPKIDSQGLEHYLEDKNYNIMDYPLPRLEFQIAAVFVITRAFDFVLKRVGLPTFLSHILAGIIFGPLVLGKYLSFMLTEEGMEVLATAASFGYVFFLFQIGVKMNVSIITRVERKAFCIGVLSVLIPLLIGLATFKSLMGKGENLVSVISLLLVGTHSATWFANVAHLLSELKLLNSELGRLVLAAAIVSDFFSFSVVTGIAFARIAMRLTIKVALTRLLLTVALILIILFVFRPVMFWVVRHTPPGKPVKDLYICGITVVFLTTIAFSNTFGPFIMFGPFVLGLAVPEGPPLGSAFEEKYDAMVSGLFMPLFLTSCAMRIQTLHINFGYKLMTINAILAAVILLAKLLVSLAVPLYWEMPKKDAWAIALIMCTKDFNDLGINAYLFDYSFMDENLFAFLAIFVTVIRSIVPILVKRLTDPSRKYAGYQKRNIMNTKPTSELQILACIHVPNNVSAVINFLDASCPTNNSPISVNVLHLVKIRGRATPLFISHENQPDVICNHSYSENVIRYFNQFEKDNRGAVSIKAFTAISPPELMHEDICTLALDKLTSLIILPFHRKWYINGSIESDDHIIRTLNCKALEVAPCSIGILVDRSYLQRSTYQKSPLGPSHNIAMIFLGGNDDREALTYAKRMAQDSRVRLTVVHLIASSDKGVVEWEIILDSQVLRDVKNSSGYITYIEETVNEATDTTLILGSMVNKYELIIVGRRNNKETQQTTGLKAWNEFPELGILGDLLASADFNARSSVLVVQQQQQQMPVKYK